MSEDRMKNSKIYFAKIDENSLQDNEAEVNIIPPDVWEEF